jgi:hypothetical protein
VAVALYWTGGIDSKLFPVLMLFPAVVGRCVPDDQQGGISQCRLAAAGQ